MSRDHRSFCRFAVIGVLAAAFALAACGRKGPLDPPPSASLVGEQAAPGGTQVNRGPIGPDGRPIAPGMQDKRVPLDVLLN